jgi:catechol 2,3-dioxygenase-like lactoylglutathione lyase family enzyme
MSDVRCFAVQDGAAMSGNEGQKRGRVGFEGVTPILRVRSVTDSAAYYQQRLGFKLDWETPGFISVSRDKCHIFLCEGDQGHFGTWIWLGVEDAEALFYEYQASEARMRHPPSNYAWAYEMQGRRSGWQRAASRLRAKRRPAHWRVAGYAAHSLDFQRWPMDSSLSRSLTPLQLACAMLFQNAAVHHNNHAGFTRSLRRGRVYNAFLQP